MTCKRMQSNAEPLGEWRCSCVAFSFTFLNGKRHACPYQSVQLGHLHTFWHKRNVFWHRRCTYVCATILPGVFVTDGMWGAIFTEVRIRDGTGSAAAFFRSSVLYVVGSGNVKGNGNIAQYLTTAFNSPRRRPRPSCDGCNDRGIYVSACCPASKISRSAGNRTLLAMVWWWWWWWDSADFRLQQRVNEWYV